MFQWAGTEFGCDPKGSVIRLRGEVGSRVLEINIAGDRARYAAMDKNSHPLWAGTLYPPDFQLYGVPAESLDGIDIELPGEYRNTIELAVYMLSHRDAEVRLTINDSKVTIVGRAEWRGEWRPLRIEWRAPDLVSSDRPGP